MFIWHSDFDLLSEIDSVHSYSFVPKFISTDYEQTATVQKSFVAGQTKSFQTKTTNKSVTVCIFSVIGRWSKKKHVGVVNMFFQDQTKITIRKSTPFFQYK